VSERDRYRLSFESVAETYERARPLYAAEALAWMAERLPLRRVLDLGAGTGKLTRQLVELGADVVAVEPGDEMRAVFARVLPEVELLAGSAEAIPLAEASVDAITAGQAFHWFEPAAALHEMHRVLRPGGGVALLWNEWDADDPLMHALGEIVDRYRPDWIREPDWEHPLQSTPLFENRELRTFKHAESVEPDVLVERVSSISSIVNASGEDRERALADVRALVGGGPVPTALVTRVGVADRA
jgi:SAM-dependent methyltransferase